MIWFPGIHLINHIGLSQTGVKPFIKSIVTMKTSYHHTNIELSIIHYEEE